MRPGRILGSVAALSPLAVFGPGARAMAQTVRPASALGPSWAVAAHMAARLLRSASPGLDRVLARNPVHGVAVVPFAAVLCTALALALTSIAERRGTGRGVPSLDVVSTAGTMRLPLARDRAQAVWSGDGEMVAQVVWSHDRGWCATAPWPHHLVGADGLACRTAALGRDHWVRVTDVRMRLNEQGGTTAPVPTPRRLRAD